MTGLKQLDNETIFVLYAEKGTDDLGDAPVMFVGDFVDNLQHVIERRHPVGPYLEVQGKRATARDDWTTVGAFL